MGSDTRHGRVRDHIRSPKVGGRIVRAKAATGAVAELTTPDEKESLPECGQGASAMEIANSLHKIPALLTIWTRCGKPNCRCTAGRLHGPYHILHWREGSVQRRRYVRTADVPAVRAIVEARRAERSAERLALALALCSWRESARWAAEYEAALRDERTGQ